MISLRTKEALFTKKLLGVKLGKPKGALQKRKFDKNVEKIKELLNYGLSCKKIARALTLSLSVTVIIMKIRVLSFDFDGCLFNNKYPVIPASLRLRSNTKVILANQTFLDSIKEENKTFEKVVTYTGSARQSKGIDDANSELNNTESCFIAIEVISKYLEATFDNFLMADIYGNLNAGTSFNRATDKSYRDSHSASIYDHTKFTLLYAQIHKISEQYPEDEITFDFYDDRGCGDIQPIDVLEDLQTYFTESPNLLPDNVTLCLKHYSGGQVTLLSSIKGTGCVDINYRKTIKDIAKKSLGFFKKSITKELLKIPGQELPEVSICTSVSNCFSSFFQCCKSDNKEKSIVLQAEDRDAVSLNSINQASF